MKDPDYLEGDVFVRKPFVVEAVKVTKENIAKIAEYVGTIAKEKDGVPYIQVNQNRVPNIEKVYLGYYVTKMGENIRCYSGKIFREQFVLCTPDIQNWVDFLNSDPDRPTFKINTAPKV